jgi:hypothetical protein
VPFESQACPTCGSTLTFHQPDPQSPQRLLATCSACRTWFISGEGQLTPVNFVQPDRGEEASEDMPD